MNGGLQQRGSRLWTAGVCAYVFITFLCVFLFVVVISDILPQHPGEFLAEAHSSHRMLYHQHFGSQAKGFGCLTYALLLAFFRIFASKRYAKTVTKCKRVFYGLCRDDDDNKDDVDDHHQHHAVVDVSVVSSRIDV